MSPTAAAAPLFNTFFPRHFVAGGTSSVWRMS